MDAYIYQADLYCASCTETIKKTLQSPTNIDDENTFDSDDYPKGPYSDGGGESDCPQHCGQCNVFLENPLTDEGYEYVKQTLLKPIEDDSILATWFDYYGFDVSTM